MSACTTIANTRHVVGTKYDLTSVPLLCFQLAKFVGEVLFCSLIVRFLGTIQILRLDSCIGRNILIWNVQIKRLKNMNFVFEI